MPKVKSRLELDAPGVQPQDAARLVDSRPEVLDSAAFAALESPPGSGLYPTLKGRRVVVTDLDDSTEAYVQTVPDYANMESTNRISVNGGQWVVDRTGFVACESYVYASNTLASGVYLEARIKLNGVVVSTESTKSAPENTTRTQTAAMVPVSPGDVVLITASAYDSTNNNAEVTTNVTSAVHCRFIPPKFVSTAAPRISPDALNVAMVPDYGNAEPTDKIALVTTGDGVSNSQNGTWIADRTGWLRVGLQIPTVTVGSGWAYYSCKVDDIVAAVQSLSPQPISGPGAGWSWETLVPVQAGQSVSLQIQSSYVNTKSICTFIPPKFVTVQSPQAPAITWEPLPVSTAASWQVNASAAFKALYSRELGQLSINGGFDVRGFPPAAGNISSQGATVDVSSVDPAHMASVGAIFGACVGYCVAIGDDAHWSNGSVIPIAAKLTKAGVFTITLCTSAPAAAALPTDFNFFVNAIFTLA